MKVFEKSATDGSGVRMIAVIDRENTVLITVEDKQGRRKTEEAFKITDEDFRLSPAAIQRMLDAANEIIPRLGKD